MGKIFRNGIAFFKGVCIRIIYKTSIGKRLRVLKGASIRLYHGSIAHIGNNVKVDTNAVIAVQRNGKLMIEDNVGIGPNNYIVCHKQIVIGEGTIMGPNVLIYDHDHSFTPENGVDAHNYTYKDVEIGKHCWIGANVVILKGTKIGDNCVVGAGSVIKGTYPDGTMILQKRETTVKKIDLRDKREIQI